MGGGWRGSQPHRIDPNLGSFRAIKQPQIWDHFGSQNHPKFGTILHDINAPNLGPLLGRPIGEGSTSHSPHRTTPNLGLFCITSMPQIWDHFGSWNHPKSGTILHHINAPNLGPFCITSMPQIWDHFWGDPLGKGPHLTPPIEPPKFGSVSGHINAPNLGPFCITSMPQIWDHFASQQCPKFGTTFEASHWGRVHISPPP